MDFEAYLPTPGHLTRILDSTLLRPEATEKEYLDFLREARTVASAVPACPFYYLPFARLELDGSGVKVGGVIGFPFGYGGSDVKRAEVVFALQQGAQEIDMVMNISALKSRRYEQVKADIGEVVHLAPP